MAENHKCDMCGKPATVHLTQIINNQSQKIDLCEACAQKKGMAASEAFGLSDLVAKTMTQISQTVGEALAQSSVELCPRCGMTPLQYKEAGRLGCPECYGALSSVVEPMLQQTQHAGKHLGKAPARDEAAQKRLELQAALKEAVAAERYEDAARYRDELGKLEAEPSAAK